MIALSGQRGFRLDPFDPQSFFASWRAAFFPASREAAIIGSSIPPDSLLPV
jgi:hypothetical protein